MTHEPLMREGKYLKKMCCPNNIIRGKMFNNSSSNNTKRCSLPWAATITADLLNVHDNQTEPLELCASSSRFESSQNLIGQCTTIMLTKHWLNLTMYVMVVSLMVQRSRRKSTTRWASDPMTECYDKYWLWHTLVPLQTNLANHIWANNGKENGTESTTDNERLVKSTRGTITQTMAFDSVIHVCILWALHLYLEIILSSQAFPCRLSFFSLSCYCRWCCQRIFFVLISSNINRCHDPEYFLVFIPCYNPDFLLISSCLCLLCYCSSWLNQITASHCYLPRSITNTMSPD